MRKQPTPIGVKPLFNLLLLFFGKNFPDSHVQGSNSASIIQYVYVDSRQPKRASSLRRGKNKEKIQTMLKTSKIFRKKNNIYFQFPL